jgi:hypothetical protein
MRKPLLLALFLVCLQPATKAQVTLVPAGTLLHCTIDDPTISPKTAEVGDPVLCHLNQFTEFGHPVFPRGSYLAGHLEAAKQPGHFIGKGYLDIVFDHIGMPNADGDLSAKIVAAQGQHVDKQGDIMGPGNVKRDVIEWMIPPLWPWKVITLPARGPQPKLKNEQLITLKIMQDVELPRLSASLSSSPQWHPSADSRTYSNPVPRTVVASAAPAPSYTSDRRVTLIALKSETIYPARDYWVAGRYLCYLLPDGSGASISLNTIDWQRTMDLNAERGVRITLRTTPTQF